jgi:hypothetical protein
MGKKLCKYIIEMRRSSDIEGVFVLTDEELEAVREMDGYEVRYGEIAGKHSDVTCKLLLSDIEILTDKEEEVAFFERILPQGAGFHFPPYWFDTDRAADDGYEAGRMKSYKDATDALETDYNQHNNNVMKKAFITAFDNVRKKNES